MTVSTWDSVTLKHSSGHCPLTLKLMRLAQTDPNLSEHNLFIDFPKATVFTIHYHNQLVGFMQATQETERRTLHTLYVKPAMRRRRIAWVAVYDWLTNTSTPVVETTKPVTHLPEFLTSVGFERCPIEDTYIWHG